MRDNEIMNVSLQSVQEIDCFMKNTIKHNEKDKRQEHIGFIIQLANKFQRYVQEFVKDFEFDQELIEFLETENERQNIDFTQSNKSQKMDEHSEKKSILKQYLS